MLSLSVMLKPSSGSCNMRCEYCFYCDEMKNRERASYGFMSEETLENVIRKTMSGVGREICYTYQGGEPTLRGLDFFRKAVELQKKYNRNNIRVFNALQTNGYALDGEWRRFFKENDFLIGVSVDGTRAIHDAYRRAAEGNAPTFDAVARNIALLDECGVGYNILTVITEAAAHCAGEIYEEYRRRGWRNQQYIACLDPLGEGNAEKSYSLRPESYGVFLTELFDLWYQDLLKGRQPYIREFDNYIAMLAGWPPEACSHRGVCGIQIAVEADGSAYPCDFYMLDDCRLGNFNEDGLPEMDARRQAVGFIQRSARISGECRSCRYFGVCRSGCQRVRSFIPDEQAYKNRFCEGYRYFFDHCLDRMQRIARRIPRRY